jgi:hypothetical protein
LHHFPVGLTLPHMSCMCCIQRNRFLTLLGGGAFGNDVKWILDAIGLACEKMVDCNLDVPTLPNIAESDKLPLVWVLKLNACVFPRSRCGLSTTGIGSTLTLQTSWRE